MFWAEEPEAFWVIAPNYEGINVINTPKHIQLQILQFKVNYVWPYSTVQLLFQYAYPTPADANTIH